MASFPVQYRFPMTYECLMQASVFDLVRAKRHQDERRRGRKGSPKLSLRQSCLSKQRWGAKVPMRTMGPHQQQWNTIFGAGNIASTLWPCRGRKIFIIIRNSTDYIRNPSPRRASTYGCPSYRFPFFFAKELPPSPHILNCMLLFGPKKRGGVPSPSCEPQPLLVAR